MDVSVASEQTGRVVAQDGEDVLVEVVGGGCGRCHEEGGCGGQQLTQMFCSTPRHYRLANTVGARPGDLVTIVLPPGALGRHVTLGYGLPLLGLLLGALAGNFVRGNGAAVIGGLIGVVLAWWLVRRKARFLAGNPMNQPHISQIKSSGG